MRKIIAGLFVSLDGVVEAPNEWSAQYADPAGDHPFGPHAPAILAAEQRQRR